jgi:undecaprenyl diphosphate synthase
MIFTQTSRIVLKVSLMLYSASRRELFMPNECKQGLPEHIAIIMDGNGRWAARRFMPRLAGHRAGLQAAKRIAKHCVKMGIRVLTLFAFSSENWRRPTEEVNFLMDLFLSTLENEVEHFHKEGISLRFIGNRTRLDARITLKMNEAEVLTKDNTALILMIGIDYGGQWDIQHAMQKIIEKAIGGEITREQLTVSMIEDALAFPDLPFPDLVIRTSGEKRISNFMLWQIAYSELYFTDTLWPDFDEVAFDAAITDYMSRERRFGYTSQTVLGEAAQ